MLSELFRIPIEVAGVPLFGLGVLLVVWLVGNGAYAAWLSRIGRGGEVKGLLPVVAIGAVAIWGVARLFPEGLPIRGYGVMLVLGASAGLAMAIHRARQRGFDTELLLSIAMGMFVCGIVGARLFYVIEYWPTRFGDEGFVRGLRKALMFTEGGLVVYGSLIGAGAYFLWACRRHKIPALALADLAAPSLLVGLALGRVGCLLNGCCYGGPCERPWAITFPQQSSADTFSPPYADQLEHGALHGLRWAPNPESGVLTIVAVHSDLPIEVGDEIVGLLTDRGVAELKSAEELRYQMEYAARAGSAVTLVMQDGQQIALPLAQLPPRSNPVHPTQIYSTINAALLAWLLWTYYPHRRRDGEVVALMLTIYPISRFLLEMIRTDESPIFGTGLSISQNVSLAILAGVACLWAYLQTQPRTRASLAIQSPQ